jgi:hypothetical protein
MATCAYTSSYRLIDGLESSGIHLIIHSEVNRGVFKRSAGKNGHSVAGLEG